jgi:hypothetical protein
MIRCAATILLTLAASGADAAGPSEKWGHDPQTSQWFKSLRSPQGVSCCDYVDGVRLEDPEWRQTEDASYEVFARGAWHKIPPEHVVTATNRVGYAILWWPAGYEEPSCFLPGAGG